MSVTVQVFNLEHNQSNNSCHWVMTHNATYGPSRAAPLIELDDYLAEPIDSKPYEAFKNTANYEESFGGGKICKRRDLPVHTGNMSPGLSVDPGRGNKRKAVPGVLNRGAHTGAWITENCDQVRRKIRKFLDSGEMTTGQFCKEIEVTNHSLNTFLKQSGKDTGEKSKTYETAHMFFKRKEYTREAASNKRRKTASSTSADKDATDQIKAAGNSSGVDITSIYLPHQDSDGVPVYDSCDEVRLKINAHMKKPGVTQAQFCRDLHAQLHSPSRPASIQTTLLTRFRSMGGATAGNSSSVYYAAYVFFEKIRRAEDKPKSKHRLEMEKIWPRGTERERSSGGLWCFGNKMPIEDKYGRISIV